MAAGKGGGALGEIAAQIMAGQPGTLSTAGGKFSTAQALLSTVKGEIPGELASVAKTWEGPAAKAFGQVGEKVATFVGETADAVRNPSWQQAMVQAAQALTEAQAAVKELVAEREGYVGQGREIDEAAFAAAAQKILDNLSTVYDDMGAAMKPVKEDPGDVTADGVAGPGAGPGEGNGDGEDAGKGDDGDTDKGAADGEEDKDAAGPGDGGPGGDKEPDGKAGPEDVPAGPTGGPDGIGGPGGPIGPGGPSIGNPKGPDLTFDDPDAFGDKVPSGALRLGDPGLGGDDPFGPSTKLQSFDPTTSGPTGPVGPANPTTLTSATNTAAATPGGDVDAGAAPFGGSPRGQIGFGSPPGGSSPASRLTSAGPLGNQPGAGPTLRGPASIGGGRGPIGPLGPAGPSSTLTSAGSRGRTGSAGRGRRPGIIDGPDGLGYYPFAGRGMDDEHDDERETWLLGDEEWDETTAGEAAIGRPGPRTE